jgi:uncharacterized membrane protein YkoI
MIASTTLRSLSSIPSRFRCSATLIAIACALTSVSLPAAEQSDEALLGKLKDSKFSLADGIAQSEKENGVAISAKFEMEGGKLSLSVYTAKAGLGKDAEHNALVELSGDPTQTTWKTDTEVFEDKKHLTRSAMQLSLVQLSKLTLAEAIKKAEAAQAGTVYSITPAAKEGSPVFNVKVANAEGKSVSLAVDGRTGEVSK